MVETTVVVNVNVNVSARALARLAKRLVFQKLSDSLTMIVDLPNSTESRTLHLSRMRSASVLAGDFCSFLLFFIKGTSSLTLTDLTMGKGSLRSIL